MTTRTRRNSAPNSHHSVLTDDNSTQKLASGEEFMISIDSTDVYSHFTREPTARANNTVMSEHPKLNNLAETSRLDYSLSLLSDDYDRENRNWITSQFVHLNQVWKRAFVALIILAVINAGITFSIAKLASYLWSWQQLVIDEKNIHTAIIYATLLFIKTGLVCGAVLLTATFAPGCAGSGVPELRAILSGIWIREYLGLRTLLIKILGLILALGAGIPIGLEGPFIHVSAILGRQLTRLPWFTHLDRKQVLSAACAGGLASVFGAPIGGVLFSIEVTSTYYPVTNYWTAFCCAVAGSTLTHVFISLSPTSLLLYRQMSDSEAKTHELGLFLVIGLACGVLGSLFVRLHEYFVRFRRNYQFRIFGNGPYKISAALVFVFVTVMYFLGDFAIQPARRSVADLFNITDLKDCMRKFRQDLSTCGTPTTCCCKEWDIRNSLMLNLWLFTGLNFMFSFMFVTLSIPCGIFAPVFTVGASLGRIFGEMVKIYAYAQASPQVYAVVGAASFAAGVTKTISPAVIALEITRQVSLSMPLLLGVIVACGVCSTLGGSFYDSVLNLRQIPLLPISPSRKYIQTRSGVPRPLIADDVMEKDFSFVTVDPNPTEIIDLLTKDENQTWFPVIHSHHERVLVGEVTRMVLLRYLQVIAPETVPDLIRGDESDEDTGHESPHTTLLLPHGDTDMKVASDSPPVKSLMDPEFLDKLNLSPIQVISEMPLSKVYTLFHVLRPANVYVTKYSRLIGVIDERNLIYMEYEESRASDTCSFVFSVLSRALSRVFFCRCSRCCRSQPSGSTHSQSTSSVQMENRTFEMNGEL